MRGSSFPRLWRKYKLVGRLASVRRLVFGLSITQAFLIASGEKRTKEIHPAQAH